MENNIFMKCKCGCNQNLSKEAINRITNIHYNKYKKFKEIGFISGHQFRGHRSRNWRGGKNITYHGYIDIRKPEHPFSSQRGYVKEHRLVMEKHLDRYLQPNEEIHHINGIKDDNRIENLIILVKGIHTSLHHKGMIKHGTRKAALKGWATRRKNGNGIDKGWETRRKNGTDTWRKK